MGGGGELKKKKIYNKVTSKMYLLNNCVSSERSIWINVYALNYNISFAEISQYVYETNCPK